MSFGNVFLRLVHVSGNEVEIVLTADCRQRTFDPNFPDSLDLYKISGYALKTES